MGSGCCTPDPCAFEVELLFSEPPPNCTATIVAGEAVLKMEIEGGKRRGHSTHMHFPSGDLTFKVEIDINGTKVGPHQVILRTQTTSDGIKRQSERARQE